MKEYKNSNELLDYIISKGVSVNNKEDTLYKIKTYSYYSIINTYKDVLKNTSILESKNNSNDFYLATIIINNDDKKYRKRIRSCGLERVKKIKPDIIVDLYI